MLDVRSGVSREVSSMDAPTVWIISPDPDTRRLIGLNLRKRGLRTVEVSTRDELTRDGVKPDLIILEGAPSDESGVEAAGVLRRNGWLQGVPLILLLTSPPVTRQLVPLRPVGWVEKPLSMDALLAQVRECLAASGRGGPMS